MPTWAAAAAGLVWLVVLVLAVAGATKWSFALFLGALLSASIGTAALVVAAVSGKEGLRAARAGALVVLATYVPVVFDPHTGDVFNLPKFTLVVIGALVLAGLWAVAATQRERLPAWRNGLHWLVVAMVVWAFLSALAGVDTKVSLLGNYGSYDGVYAACAFVVVMMAAAEAFDAADVRRALSAVAFAGGSVVVFYGLLQLHDTEFLTGARWDFINWHATSFVREIFSTLGNPNHLAGFLSVVLPVVVVLGLSARARTAKVAAALLAAVTAVEIVRSSARGAWVATLVSFAVLALFLAPEVRRRLKLYAAGTAAVLVVVVGGLAVGGQRFLSHPLSTLFQSGSTSSVGQRFQIWSAVLSMVGRHPLFGLGPDNLALIFPRYQSASWVKALGPNYLVNGAHDIFFNYLADQGPVGLLLFLALLVLFALRAVGAWRRLRVREQGAPGEPAAEEAHQLRLTVAVLAAAVTAYVVQASFDVQQIALSFTFWLLVGLSVVATRQAGVPASLRPALLVARTEAGTAERPGTVPAPGRPKLPARPAGGRRRPAAPARPAAALTSVVALLATAAVVFLAVEADRPYRADHDYWAAMSPLATSNAVGTSFFTNMKHAISLNPGEGTYPAAEGNVWAELAPHATSTQQAVSELTSARTLYAQATADKPLWALYPANLAQTDLDLAHLQPASAGPYLAQGIAMAKQALADNPRNTTYQSLLAQLEAASAPPAKAPAPLSGRGGRG